MDGGSDYCRVGYPGGNPDDWIEHLPLTWRSARDGIDRALPEIDDDYLIAIIGWMRYTATLIPPFTRPPEEIWTGAGGLGYNHLIEEAKLRGLDCG